MQTIVFKAMLDNSEATFSLVSQFLQAHEDRTADVQRSFHKHIQNVSYKSVRKV